MNIKHESSASTGVFSIEEKGKRLGELVYRKINASLISIDHTEVSEILRGKGAGKQLVSAAVDYARHHAMKIKPHCSFARALFERIPEFQDVLYV